jgi:hypothetical protein
MFFIFKILPDWFWWLLLLGGLFAFFVSYLPQAKTLELPIKIVALTTIVITIFIFGMLYADNTWKAAAVDLQAKVLELSKQSDAANTAIKEKTITQLQIVKLRGEEVVRYIDREVTKSDVTCLIPPSFVQAHNQAAEAPK